MAKILKSYGFILFLLILVLPALFSLFHPGMFVSDDGGWMIIRLSAFYETFKSGQIPVRFIARLNNEYGYPLTDFVYPGFLYLGVPLHLLGFGFITSAKIIVGLSFFASALGMFLWLRKAFSSVPAFFGSLFYIYAPYHLYDAYSRGSIGELLALGLVPFIFWQIEKKNIFLTSIGIACLMLSHNIIAFIFIPPLFFYLFFTSKGKSSIYKVLVSCIPFIIGLLLSMFFWFPALYDLHYTVFAKTVVSDWRLYFSWPSLIGYSFIFILVVSGSIFFQNRNKKSHFVSFVLFLITIVYLYFSVNWSSFLWEKLPAYYVQFPFRLLSIVILLLSYLFGYILFYLPKKFQIWAGVGLLLLTVIFSYPFLFPKGYRNDPEGYYSTNFSTTTIKNEYMPEWVKVVPDTLPKAKVEILQGKGKIQNITSNGRKTSFQAEISAPSLIQINTLYFPGWKVFVDGKKQTVRYNNPYGVIQFPLSEGTHTITSLFTETIPRLISDVLSLSTAIVIGTWWVYRRFFYGKKVY